MNIGIIGVGKMGEAIARALAKSHDLISLYIYDRDASKSNCIGKELGVNHGNMNNLIQQSNIIIIAVKPQDFESLPAMKNKIIVSIMAGVPIEKLRTKLQSDKVIRVMPNLCCTVQESCSAFACSAGVSKEENAFVRKLLQSFGLAVEVKEELMDAVTGLSGSGPAYVAYLIEQLAEAGKKQGLENAYEMALQTVAGTARLLKEKNCSPEELIAMVSSKGGTTERGMGVLKDSNIASILSETVRKAAERSKELGGRKAESYVDTILAKALEGKNDLAALTAEQANKLLANICDKIKSQKQNIIAENRKDLDLAKDKGEAFLQRLEFNEKMFGEIMSGIQGIRAIEDPYRNPIEEKTLPNGLKLKKVRVPLGVVLAIYESRPNVTIDLAAIGIKSRNVLILKGGSESLNTNRVLHLLIKQACEEEKINPDIVQLVEGRDIADDLLCHHDKIDLVIPRGGYDLIKKVSQVSKIPVIKHDAGVCSIYIDKDADTAMALNIIENAKCQKPSACNAVENLLIHEKIAKKFLPLLQKRLDSVELRGCEKTQQIITCKPAAEEDWKTEYGAKIVAIKIVGSTEEAIAFIEKYGSHHSDAIITADKAEAEKFLTSVDSACVYWNASTRFTDGGQFGMGCETGISTQKLHARGPMGINEMTSYKWVVVGEGQVRK